MSTTVTGDGEFFNAPFECSACDHVDQRVVELVDPMNSPETSGWLRWELRTPT